MKGGRKSAHKSYSFNFIPTYIFFSLPSVPPLYIYGVFEKHKVRVSIKTRFIKILIQLKKKGQYLWSKKLGLLKYKTNGPQRHRNIETT